MEEVEAASEGDEEDDGPKYVQKYQKIVPNIQQFWLRMIPDQDDFIETVCRCFSHGLNSIQMFERWGKHADLKPYADALEDWDDIVGDEWDEPDQLMLDPKSWISEDPIFVDQKERVEEIINNAYDKANTFLSRF